LGDLKAKFEAFGWDVARCDGHDLLALQDALGSPSIDGRPKVVIADTVKGKGVSFMEHTSMKEGQEYYQYHSGAPTYDNYKLASKELLAAIQARLRALKMDFPVLAEASADVMRVPQNTERMMPAYADAILEQARAHSNLVALDADLILDTGLIPFKGEFPERFIECGIAEQDMVSLAGTMALGGLVPVVHSFACFLTSRASEQIYNNCTQGKKVIYVGSLAGMPGMTIIEPVNAMQLKAALKWAIDDTEESTYLRLTSIPYEQTPELAQISALRAGRGDIVREGTDVAIIAFGPVMAFQALDAAAGLAQRGISAAVAVTPWINHLDPSWLASFIGQCPDVITLENHYSDCGAGNFYIGKMAGLGLLKDRRAFSLGIDRIPACGRNDEVLSCHELSSSKLTDKIIGLLRQC
jgi:transketolase